MRALFTIDAAGNVVIDPAAYGVAAYRKLWDRDKTKSKDKAIGELGYVYYMNDFRSFVGDIKDRSLRHKEVVKLVFPSKLDYVADKVVVEAMEIYKLDVPYSVGVLDDAKTGVEALRKYFRVVDLTEMNDKGTLVYDAAKLRTNLANLAQVMESISKLEMKVKQDVDSSDQMRGGKIKGYFEDDGGEQ